MRTRSRITKERRETKKLGDVQLDIVERDGEVVQLSVHHSGSVPNLLNRFSPEVQKRAERFWWSTARDRRILREARQLGDMSHAIVRQALLHDRAVAIERRLHRKSERQRLKRERKLFKVNPVVRNLGARGGTALQSPSGGHRLSATQIMRQQLGLPDREPYASVTQDRARR